MNTKKMIAKLLPDQARELHELAASNPDAWFVIIDHWPMRPYAIIHPPEEKALAKARAKRSRDQEWGPFMNGGHDARAYLGARLAGLI